MEKSDDQIVSTTPEDSTTGQLSCCAPPICKTNESSTAGCLPAAGCCDDSLVENVVEADCCPSQSLGSCCPPIEDASSSESESPSCCPPAGIDRSRPGFKICSYVTGWLSVAGQDVPMVSTKVTWRDRLSRWGLRWGIGRSISQVAPGLYAVGAPDAESPVFVSANYRMSFDYLRTSLRTQNCWLLVLDTKGVNVWCAAGKGTFGTKEIINRVKLVGLEGIVNHRQLIVPQLGAPGVSAHQVKKGTSFSVLYGPVKAQDLPDYINAGMKATPSMRLVTFNAWERFILTPVEIVVIWRHLGCFLLLALLLSTIGEHFFSLAVTMKRFGGALLFTLLGVVAGAVVTPTILPLLPGKMFSLKGATVGAATAIVAIIVLFDQLSPLSAVAGGLLIISIASYGAMNFTGSSTFTSPSGVEKEMRVSIPIQLAALVVAAIVWIWDAF